MTPKTTMHICQDIVLECQHCYVICRYSEAAVRRNCPACGRNIGNWDALTHALQEKMSAPSDTSQPSS